MLNTIQPGTHLVQPPPKLIHCIIWHPVMQCQQALNLRLQASQLGPLKQQQSGSASITKGCLYSSSGTGSRCPVDLALVKIGTASHRSMTSKRNGAMQQNGHTVASAHVMHDTVHQCQGPGQTHWLTGRVVLAAVVFRTLPIPNRSRPACSMPHSQCTSSHSSSAAAARPGISATVTRIAATLALRFG